MVDLSKIERVDPREIWQHEAKHFTPWLAENLSDLGEALGLHLELRGIEVQVGSYSLDILAHDMGGQAVIIENQLEPTDHDHLGKLLTYAAGHDAGTIVWIAKEFRDEHRAALNYLNSRTGEDTKFFGVVVELWKIDDSRPAVKFDLVVDPNAVVVPNGEGEPPPEPPTERQKRFIAFFQPLIDTLRENGATKARKASGNNWFNTGSGSTRVEYWVEFAGSKGKIRVQVYIDRDKEWNERLFDKLEERKETIESKLGESLSWERLDDRKACRIAVYRPGTIDDDEVLEEIQEWAVEWMLAFRQVFGPELEELVPIVDELAE